MIKKRKLLIADDSEINRVILANMLEQEFDIVEVSDGEGAVTALENGRGTYSALLLDLIMPGMSGFDVLEEVKRRQWTDELPIIMISAESGSSYIDRAFDLGASDYISRPFAPGVVRHRIINTILLHKKKKQLMDVVASWFYRREKNNEVMVSILDYAMEVRSGEKGSHMFGVSRLTGILLEKLMSKTDSYEIGREDAELIATAAGLHDIGKLLIPEEILKKPGKLTAAEYETVKHHTQIGAQLISELPLYRNEKLAAYAAEICRWHHERWDGKGYPDGLQRDSIPIAAQVASVADVYDALTNERSYKKAYSHEKTLEMIRGGECGSFNPLLLECLTEIAGQAIPSSEEKELWHRRDVIHCAVDELYHGQDSVAARITRQLEDMNAKQEFMQSTSDELWFEYTRQPSSLRLSKGAAECTGLPPVTVNPHENKEFCEVIGRETVAEIHRRISELAADEDYTEMTVQIKPGGKPCRCRLAILVLRSSAENGRYSSFIGKAADIDESFSRLESIGTAPPDSAEEQVLIPVGTDGDGILRLTAGQVRAVMQGYRRMFRTVRLVDPGICMQISVDRDGHSVENSEKCYSMWNKTQQCRNCISQETVRTRCMQSKVEAVDNDVYYVVAMCVEVDGVLYALECINPIHHIGSGVKESDNILSQLLVRNRQVYTDSITNAYNRRYYDVHAGGYTGEYAVAMLDIDNFKQINDTFGHAAGDAALYRIAYAVRSLLRSNDELIRYGGDEFIIIFSGLPDYALEKKLDDICSAVRKIEISEYPELHLTVSVGGIHALGRITELVHKADRALYRAKEKKNCSIVYSEEEYI